MAAEIYLSKRPLLVNALGDRGVGRTDDMFPLDPQAAPAHVCGVCGAEMKLDRRGVLRHKSGDGRRCDQWMSLADQARLARQRRRSDGGSGADSRSPGKGIEDL